MVLEPSLHTKVPTSKNGRFQVEELLSAVCPTFPVDATFIPKAKRPQFLIVKVGNIVLFSPNFKGNYFTH